MVADASQAEWRPWLALRMVHGVGPVVYQSLLRAFGTPGAVFEASAHALECAGLRGDLAHAIHRFDGWRAVDEQLERLARSGAALVTWNDPALSRQPPPDPRSAAVSVRTWRIGSA